MILIFTEHFLSELKCCDKFSASSARESLHIFTECGNTGLLRTTSQMASTLTMAAAGWSMCELSGPFVTINAATVKQSSSDPTHRTLCALCVTRAEEFSMVIGGPNWVYGNHQWFASLVLTPDQHGPLLVQPKVTEAKKCLRSLWAAVMRQWSHPCFAKWVCHVDLLTLRKVRSQEDHRMELDGMAWEWG